MNDISKRTATGRAFTLIEVCFCLLIFMIAALSIAASIVYARKTLELNKQRIAAMNICRQNMEAIMGFDTVPSGTKSINLLNSNAYDSKVDIEYYAIKGASLSSALSSGQQNHAGEVDWDLPKTGPSLSEPTYVRVTVSWKSTGVFNRIHTYSLQGLVTKGII